MSAKYRLRITGECKHNMKLCNVVVCRWMSCGLLLENYSMVNNSKKSIMRIS